MTDQPEQEFATTASTCEHHYESRLRGGEPLYVRVCVLCGGIDWDDLREQAAAIAAGAPTETDLRAVYRERAHLVALLAAIYPSALGYTDPNEPDWPVLYLNLPTGQASWHIAPEDVDLFGHVQRDDTTEWDGHTTDAKYARIRQHTAELVQRCGRECREGHTYTGRCELAPAVPADTDPTEQSAECTCASAGEAFCPAGHYADCPAQVFVDQPAEAPDDTDLSEADPSAAVAAGDELLMTAPLLELHARALDAIRAGDAARPMVYFVNRRTGRGVATGGNDPDAVAERIDAAADRPTELGTSPDGLNETGGSVDTPANSDLTADEARELAAELGVELYQAQDALAFAREMCDLADRNGSEVTTERVRAWLDGPKCGRQLLAEQAGQAPADPGLREWLRREIRSSGRVMDVDALTAVLCVRDDEMQQLRARVAGLEQRLADSEAEVARQYHDCQTVEALIARVRRFAELYAGSMHVVRAETGRDLLALLDGEASAARLVVQPDEAGPGSGG